MTIDDNRGGSFQKTQNQYDIIYVQPLTNILIIIYVSNVTALDILIKFYQRKKTFYSDKQENNNTISWLLNLPTRFLLPLLMVTLHPVILSLPL